MSPRSCRHLDDFWGPQVNKEPHLPRRLSLTTLQLDPEPFQGRCKVYMAPSPKTYGPRVSAPTREHWISLPGMHGCPGSQPWNHLKSITFILLVMCCSCSLAIDFCVCQTLLYYSFNKRLKTKIWGRYLAQWVKMLLGSPTPHIRVPGFVFLLHSRFQLPANVYPGGSK